MPKGYFTNALSSIRLKGTAGGSARPHAELLEGHAAQGGSAAAATGGTPMLPTSMGETPMVLTAGTAVLRLARPSCHSCNSWTSSRRAQPALHLCNLCNLWTVCWPNLRPGRVLRKCDIFAKMRLTWQRDALGYIRQQAAGSRQQAAGQARERWGLRRSGDSMDRGASKSESSQSGHPCNRPPSFPSWADYGGQVCVGLRGLRALNTCVLPASPSRRRCIAMATQRLRRAGCGKYGLRKSENMRNEPNFRRGPGRCKAWIVRGLRWTNGRKQAK